MEVEDRSLPTEVYLEILNGDREGEMFPVIHKTVTIGRGPHCDLILPDPYISRKHCQIVFRGDHFTVVDLGSLNKTRVKGKEYIQKNIKNGYILVLGKTEVRFVWEKAKEWLAAQGLDGKEGGEEEQEQASAGEAKGEEEQAFPEDDAEQRGEGDE